ncbi:MAG: protein kinase [Polyangiales bacterium]
MDDVRNDDDRALGDESPTSDGAASSPRSGAIDRASPRRTVRHSDQPPGAVAEDTDIGAPPFEALPERPTGDRFIVHDEIGRGGMGVVYRVFDRHVRRHAARKLLAERFRQRPAIARRFLEEAQITGQLDHPNIIPVHDLEIGDDGSPHGFTMKLVEGETLDRALTPNRVASRSEEELQRQLRVLLKVCEAVSFAHSRGVVHRDIKPHNVMIGEFGQVYLLDWGLALLREPRPRDPDAEPATDRDPSARKPQRVTIARESNGEPDRTVLGTFEYMAPEQAWGNIDEIDERTDVFALGAVLYQILTGWPPYVARSSQDTLDLARCCDIKSPSEVAPNALLPPALVFIALRALSRRPDERFQSATSMAQALEQCMHAGWWFASEVFAPGTVIVREGEEPRAAYLITRGTCEAFKETDGRRVVLRQMVEGDVFGESAIVTDAKRTASVAAVTRVHATVITREALEREMRADSWIGAFVRALVGRFREVDAQVRR